VILFEVDAASVAVFELERDAPWSIVLPRGYVENWSLLLDFKIILMTIVPPRAAAASVVGSPALKLEIYS
jgi:hypothetical protein